MMQFCNRTKHDLSETKGDFTDLIAYRRKRVLRMHSAFCGSSRGQKLLEACFPAKVFMRRTGNANITSGIIEVVPV